MPEAAIECPRGACRRTSPKADGWIWAKLQKAPPAFFGLGCVRPEVRSRAMRRRPLGWATLFGLACAAALPGCYYNPYNGYFYPHPPPGYPYGAPQASYPFYSPPSYPRVPPPPEFPPVRATAPTLTY
jgi:hypothetical protein